jgi:hypothetical protein
MGWLSDFSYWNPPIVTIVTAMVVSGIVTLILKIKEKEREK